VKTPLVEIDPADAAQFTALFSVPETAAVNAWVWPETTFALDGDTVTRMPFPPWSEVMEIPKVWVPW